MLRTCVVLTVALVAAGAGANSTRGAELWSLLQVWRPALQLQWSDSPALSAQCGASMQRFSRALDERQQWASRMLDATGQASSQFLSGSDYWLGSRSDCMRALHDVTGAHNQTRRAVFRVASLSVNLSEPLVTQQFKNVLDDLVLPRRIYQGLCLPAECGSKEEVRSLLELMIEHAEPSEIRGLRDVRVHAVKVLPGEYSVWTDPWFWVLGIISAIVLLPAIVGSTIDILKLFEPDKLSTDKHPGRWREIALSFSLGRNARSLFSTRSKEGSLTTIHGLRFFGMTWIILCHICRWAYIFAANPSFRNGAQDDILFQTVANGTFSVDTFLFIGGVLLAYLFLRSDSPTKKIDSFAQSARNFLWISFYRLLRLTPPYFFLLVLTLVSMRYLSVNSVFEPSIWDHRTCPKYWWRNLLYVQNLFPVKQMCVGSTWYLAVDTQLYVLSVVLLLLFANGWARTSVFAGVVILVSSWITTGAISLSLDFVPTFEVPTAHFDQLHDKPWLRLGPYFVGLVTGWYLQKTDCKISMSKIVVVAGWTVSVAGIFGIVHVLYFRAFGLWTSALYVSLSHTLWAVCLAWILVACSSGYGGWTTHIFGAKLLAPFGRATYCTYLIHYPLMEWVFLNLEGPFIISRGMMLVTTCGFVLVSNVIGMLMTLLLESPFLKLLSLAHPMRQRPPQYRPPAEQTEYEMANIQQSVRV